MRYYKFKKLYISIVIFCFTLSNGWGFLSLPQGGRFGPQAQLAPIDTEMLGKPKDMLDILPYRPVAARDKYGNRLYFTPSGKLTLKISIDGSYEFSLTAMSKQRDAEGNLERIIEKQQGSNLVVIKNEKGEVLGYQELGLGGKVIKEYDKDMNLMRSYKYDVYGKRVVLTIDERTQIRTIYDEKNRAIVDVNAEGTEVAWYVYDEHNILRLKRDIFGNKTYFDERGRMLYTEDKFGNIIEEYYYTKDDEGYEVLEKSVDYLGNQTYYKNNRPVVVKDKNGEIIKEYKYDGTTLVYSFNRKNNVVTWYDIDGRILYTSYDESKVNEYLYSEGKLIGIFDWTNYSLVVFINEQEVAKLLLKEKPTAEQIKEWISKGYIKKEYISEQPLPETVYKMKLSPTMLELYQPRNMVYVKSNKNKEYKGYFNDNAEFIPIEVIYYNKNGLVEKKENLISGKGQEFDTTGKLVNAYSKVVILENGKPKEKIYEAKISYNKDGSYYISYKGIIDKDNNPNTTSDIEVIEDAQVEHYSFDGRLLSVVSKNFVDGEYKTSIKNMFYDASGSLIYVENRDEDGKLLSKTFYKHTLEQYTLKYIYDNNGNCLREYVSSRNFYDGMKLIKTETYEPSENNASRLLTTIFYDKHQRVDEIFDSLGRIIQKNVYNDTKKDVVNSIKIEGRNKIGLEVRVVGGGVLYTENYTYIENTLQHTMRTYYHNGNIERPAISYLVDAKTPLLFN